MNRRERVALVLRLQEEMEGENPLYFNPAELPEYLSRYSHLNPVEKVLAISYYLETYNTQSAAELGDSDEAQETNGSRRSSFDLWRMLRGLGYNTSLTEVMHELYTNRDRFTSNVCGGVGRRVFRIPDLWGVSYTHFSENEPDEYGLAFFEWESLDGPRGISPATRFIYDPHDQLWREEFKKEFMPKVQLPERF